MKTSGTFAVVVLVYLAGCSGRNPGTQSGAAAHDSLKSVDSATAVQPERLLTYEEREGKFLYDRYCAVCHGPEGKGDGFNAFNLDPRPRDFSDSVYMKALGEQEAVQIISGGGRSVNKSPLMPSYGWTLKPAEIRYVESYLRTFSAR